MFVTFVLSSIVAAAGAILTTLQALMTVVFRRKRRFFAEGLREQAVSSPRSRPAVSIIKPLCGLDDDLEANLESFALVRGVDFEVVLSVADPGDPAVAVARRVMSRHADARWKLVLGGDPRLERGNRKVARLIAAAAEARSDVLLISDSNVRVEPDDVARTVALFSDSRVGCVSNLFTGAGAQSLGAVIESLHLLSFVVAGNILAAVAGVPCVVGKSMAISRAALRAIGGFEAFAHVLAEDQAVGRAVRDAGYQVVLSPVVVRNVVVRRTLRRALGRQVRWNKMRYAFSHSLYAAELLLFPLPFAIVSGFLGAVIAGSAVPFAALVLLTLLLRVAQVAVIARATAAPLRARELCLVPLLDMLQFGAQFVPFVSNRVLWRGHTARIGRNTVMLDAETPLAA
jgi:ceramide glucosyltransferase